MTVDCMTDSAHWTILWTWTWVKGVWLNRNCDCNKLDLKLSIKKQRLEGSGRLEDAVS